MAGTPYSYRTYQGGAAGLSLGVPFPFIKRAHVAVFADLDLTTGEFDKLYVNGVDYNWITNGNIVMVASTVGQKVTVIRGTPTDTLLVGFEDGSNVDMNDLRISNLQVLYAVQEQRDRVLVSVSVSLGTAGNYGDQLTQLTAQNTALQAQVNELNASLIDTRSIALAAADVGDIKYTTALNDPLGWGPAIGATVSRTTFAELFAKFGAFYGAGDGSTTFVAGPDCRGVSLRGLDNGRGLDAGRAKGSLQGDQNKAQTISPVAESFIPTIAANNLTVSYQRVTPASGSGVVAANLEATGATARIGGSLTFNPITPTINSITTSGGTEVRVKNVAERAIMKYYSRAIAVDLGATTGPPTAYVPTGLDLWFESPSSTSAWTDLSGNGRTLLQANDNYKPVLTIGSSSNSFNGLPFITFDGVDDVMEAVTSANVVNYSLMIIARVNTGGGNEDFLAGIGQSTPVPGRARYAYRTSGYFGGDSTKMGFSTWENDYYSGDQSCDIGGSFHIWTFVQNGNSIYIGRDGVGTTYELPALPSTVNAAIAVLGGRAGSVGAYAAAISVASRMDKFSAISVAERQKWEGYAADKFWRQRGVAVPLLSGHPYYTSPPTAG
jgi:microcystin-dependent protein